GLLSMEEACSRYALTVDEFLAWQMPIYILACVPSQAAATLLRAVRPHSRSQWKGEPPLIVRCPPAQPGCRGSLKTRRPIWIPFVPKVNFVRRQFLPHNGKAASTVVNSGGDPREPANLLRAPRTMTIFSSN